jgi:hypothetical protein
VDGITDGLSVLKSARARAVIPTVKFPIGNMAAPAPAPASRCCALAASAWHAHLVSEAGGQEHTNGLVPVLSCCQSSHCMPWRACDHAIFSPSSNAASRKRLQCAGCWRWRASSAGHGKIAAFPRLWSVVGLNEGFVVQDAGGQPLAYVYFEARNRWIKVKNPAAPAVKREAEEEWR